MTTYFMDTSAIIKHYVVEVGSAWITTLIQPSPGHVIVIARITIVETCSALARRQRANQLIVIDKLRLHVDFLLHADNEYLTVQVDDAVINRARDLVDKYPLRTLDAIQLACAQETSIFLGEPLTFLSADNNLLNAAAGEGFMIDNPLAHL